MTAPNDGAWATESTGQDSAPLSTAPPAPCAFSVRVEFDQRVADEDFRADLSGNPSHRLFDFLPRIATNDADRAEIELTVPGADIWTSILTAMAVIRQSGYDPAAVHVTTSNELHERGRAA
jgi:hypothetical protein